MSNKFICLSVLPLSILINSTIYKPLKAQTAPRIIPRDIEPPSSSPLSEPQTPQQLPSPSQLLPTPSPTPNPPEEFPTTDERTFVVKEFEVVGSTAFSKLELAKLLQEFTNRPITLSDLYTARQKISGLYRDKGYINSGAYIPPQVIKSGSGIFKIQIIENKLAQIKIRGTRQLRNSYISSRIAVDNKGPVNQQNLLRSLQLLKLNPLIRNISAELVAGDRPYESKLVVDVQEAKTFSSQIILDNARTPIVGTFQRRLQINEANLLGLGDGLSINYSNTDGSNVVNIGYTLPINPKNGTLSFYYGSASSDVVERPFNILDIHLDNRYYEISLRQPILQTPTQEFALGITASRIESEASYVPVDQRIAFPQLGSDDDGRTRVSALRFFQEWTVRNNRSVFGVRSQFNLGIGAFNATINQNAPDSRFFSWLGQAQWVQTIAPDTFLLLRMNAQLSATTLVPNEQFSLGGVENVRGYRQDSILSDNGVFASAEVRIPVIRSSAGVLQVIPFTDFGVAWNNSTELSNNTLASAGLGLRWSDGDRFSARLDYGIPLVSVDQPNRTWQENGLYFSLQYNPF